MLIDRDVFDAERLDDDDDDDDDNNDDDDDVISFMIDD